TVVRHKSSVEQELKASGATSRFLLPRLSEVIQESVDAGEALVRVKLVRHPEVTFQAPRRSPTVSHQEAPAVHGVVVPVGHDRVPTDDTLIRVGRPDSIGINVLKRFWHLK